MKSRSIILALLSAGSWPFLSLAQCMMIEVPFEIRTVNTQTILEGKILNQYSFWNAEHTRIYTSNTVEIYKVFKGDVTSMEAKIITEGGIVGSDMERVEPGLQLGEGQVGIFFLEKTKIGDPSEKLSLDRFIAYAAAQGFIVYNLDEKSAYDPFRRYMDIEKEVYVPLIKQTGKMYKSIRPFDIHSFQGKEGGLFSVPSITSFSPTTASAGTYTEITINGSGFGSSQGTSVVKFKNADNGGSTYITPDPTQYKSWSDNQIKVQVPVQVSGTTGNAGTGTIQVKVGSNIATSTGTLTVPFGVFNVQYSGGIHQMDFVNSNGNGGLTFQMNTSFAGNAQAVAAFTRAFNTWRCGSYVNWELGSTTSVNTQASDGTSVIRFDSGSELPAGVIGRLNSWWSGCAPAGNIWFVKDCDLVYDSGTNWNYSTGPPSSSQNDFESTTLHELGHAQQLTHVIKPSDAMHYATAPGMSQRTLTTDALSGAAEVLGRSAVPNACGNSEMILLTPGNCFVGMNEEQPAPSGISIFPNPSSGIFSIGFSDKEAAFTQAEVFNAFGDKILDQDTETKQNVQIDLSGFAAGIYTIRLADGTGSATIHKLIRK